MITITNLSAFTCSGPRPNQEDFIISSGGVDDRIFVLCDGMGGHGHGEVASKTIAEAVYSYLKELQAKEYTPENLQDAVDYASDLLAKNNIYDDDKPMGTTLVVLAINRMSILVGHIGDSRCYQFDKDANLCFRSKDHSKVQEAIDAEILTEEEAWNHPRKNILTRCIMAGRDVAKIDVDVIEVNDGDVFLMCTDGVTDALRDKQIQSVLVERSLDEVSEIIASECELKSRDNYSAILLSLAQDEVNLPKVPKTPVATPDSSEDLKQPMTKFCIHCGESISVNSQFCPHCGKSTTSGSTLPPPIPNENTFIERIKSIDFQGLTNKYSPIIYTAGGIAVGLLAAWGFGMFDSHYDASSSVTHLESDSIAREEFSSFIKGVCSIDSTNLSDSLISKDSLETQFQDFMNTLGKKNDGQ